MGNFYSRKFSSNGVSDRQEDGGGEPPRKQQKCNALDCATSHHVNGGQSCREQNESDQPHQPRAGIGDLPEEILVRILSSLTLEEILEVTQSVCQRWRRLAHDPALWSEKELCIDSLCTDCEAVAKLQQIPQLRRLEVTKIVSAALLDAVCENCPCLTSLKLHQCHRINYALLEKLTERCPNISALTVSHELLDDEHKANTWGQLKRLQSLEIEVDPSNDRRIHIRPLADLCPELKSLEVTDSANIFGRDLRDFFTVKSETLSRLVLPWAMCCRNGLRCLVPMLRSCSSLSYLQLFDCNVTAEEAPEAFAALCHLSNLRTLIMEGLLMCPPGEAARPFESGMLSRLQVLRIVDSTIQDDVVLAACLHCEQLKELRLNDCCRITDNALGNLHRLQKLEILDLSSCTRLRREALHHVAQVTTLKSLFLDYLKLRDLQPGLEKLIDITTLERISINHSFCLSVFPFEALATKLVHLRELNLRNCQVDDSVLKRLQEQMPTLKVNYEPRGLVDPETEPEYSDTDEEHEDVGEADAED